MSTNFLVDDHLVLRVDGDLDIVADGDLGMGGHRPAVGIGQRYLALAAPLQFRQQRPVSPALLAQRSFASACNVNGLEQGRGLKIARRPTPITNSRRGIVNRILSPARIV
jgi:hypothetical protein